MASLVFVANHTTSVALGDVVKKIRDAHTMSCSATIESPADAKHPVTMKMYINQAGRMRIEGQQGFVQIFDHAAGKILMLNVNTKQATVATTGAGDADNGGAGGWIGAIKSLNVKDAKDLGEKGGLDGRKAKGFLVNKEGSQFSLPFLLTLTIIFVNEYKGLRIILRALQELHVRQPNAALVYVRRIIYLQCRTKRPGGSIPGIGGH